MKNRRKPEKTREVIFGVNPVTEALRAGSRIFYRIAVKQGIKSSGPIQNITDLAARKKIPVEYAPIDTVARMAGAEGHQGVAALVSPRAYVTLDRLIETARRSPRPVVAVLDGIMDPRNLGAIIRSAEAFGLIGVVFPERRAADYTPVAAKASAGAGERIALCRVTNIAETVRRLREEGFECVALDSAAREVLGAGPEGPVALVLGGEGTGVRPLVMKRCHRAARIPLTGKIGSLNVSAAAAIAFYLSRHGRE